MTETASANNNCGDDNKKNINKFITFRTVLFGKAKWGEEEMFVGMQTRGLRTENLFGMSIPTVKKFFSFYVKEKSFRPKRKLF